MGTSIGPNFGWVPPELRSPDAQQVVEQIVSAMPAF